MPNDTNLRELVREILREEIRSALREVLPELVTSPGDPGSKPASGQSAATTMWTVAQAARFLGVSTSWIYHRSAEGSIPCVRIGHALRFDPSALAAWTRGERRGGRVVALK